MGAACVRAAPLSWFAMAAPGAFCVLNALHAAIAMGAACAMAAPGSWFARTALRAAIARTARIALGAAYAEIAAIVPVARKKSEKVRESQRKETNDETD